ncbi:general amino acid permease agp2 [Microbotryomycetes sp. JL201]|nr:general amino acid permease agp2 [Microbotryomycetes sp. JL201]
MAAPLSSSGLKERKADKTSSLERTNTKEYVDTASIASDDAHRFASTKAHHGGTIGTALFIYMGSGLTNGGPANLLMAYAAWSSVIWAVAECQIEMVCQWPTDSAFTRNAARYIDDAAGFATGWNFWLSQQALVIFEVVSFGLILGYWPSSQDVNAAVYITIMIVAYIAINVWTARGFANAEFGMAMGKLILIVSLLLFTFIAMLGGNPQGDRFGFRYWKNPGAFTTPYPEHPRGVGRFEGFLACVINACFTVAGPDYLSMVAGEARQPRKVMRRAFKTTVYRLIIFFIGSALAIGVLVPFDDANLLGAQSSGAPGGAQSPYVIGMRRLGISVYPDIVNALILTSVFSAGQAFTFGASRSLASLARDGQAPKFFARRNRNGVPYVAVLATMVLALLSYCQVSSTAAVVIEYLTGLVGSCQLVNWIVMSWSWIRWNSGLKAQGISRETLPVRSRFQPFAAWYALVASILVILMQGYGVFLKGYWNTQSFIFSYFAPALFAVLFVGWKIIKRTTYYKPSEMDVTSFVNDPEFTEDQAYDAERGRIGSIVHKGLSKVF